MTARTEPLLYGAKRRSKVTTQTKSESLKLSGILPDNQNFYERFMMNHFRLYFCFVLAASLFSGCQRGPQLPPGLPKLTSCKLVFTQEGQPLEGARVALVDTVQPQSWHPGGVTDEKGEVELYTNGKYKGAPSGTYKITVTKIHTEPSKHGPPLEEGAPGYEEWYKKASQETRETYSVIDAKFTDVRTSPLEVSIPGGTTTFDIGKAVKDVQEPML